MQASSDEEDGRGGAETRKRELPAEAVSVLKAWLMAPEHLDHPYPSPQDQQLLLEKTGIGKKQLKNWFTNARRRIWKPMMKKKQDEVDKQRTITTVVPPGLGTSLPYDHAFFHTSPLLQQHWRHGLPPPNPVSTTPHSSSEGHNPSQMMQHHMQPSGLSKIPNVGSLSNFDPLFEDDNSTDTTGETQEPLPGSSAKRDLLQPSHPAKRKHLQQPVKSASLADKPHDDETFDFFHSANTTDLSASEYELPAANQDCPPVNFCILCRQFDVNVELYPCHCRFHALCLRDCLLRQDGPAICPRCRAPTSRCHPLVLPVVSTRDIDQTPADEPSAEPYFPQDQEIYQASHTPSSALTEEDV